MRRGITLSVLLHVCIGFFVMMELPNIVIPEKEITQINVKLVSAPKDSNPKPTKKTKVEKVNSQQSAAPKKATKKKKEETKKSDAKTKVVKNKDAEKVIKQQEQKKPEEKESSQNIEENKQDWRPEKLDKTPDKKNIKKDKSATKKAEPVDDFLDTLDFIDELENEQKQAKKIDEAELEDEYSVYDLDQLEIAKIKHKIQSNWYKTAGSNKQEQLVSVVRLSLERDGTVRKVKIVKSSGKGFFDRSLERAIRKSSPLPIPVDKYEIYKTIELRFKG